MRLRARYRVCYDTRGRRPWPAVHTCARACDRPCRTEGHDRLRALPQAQLQEVRRLPRDLLHRRHAIPTCSRYLYGPLAAYSANAGKRHRPLICLLACEAVGGDPKQAWPSAAAIEHFHTAALIHDDIEDSSLTRRGEPCLHIARGRGARHQRRRPRALARDRHRRRRPRSRRRDEAPGARTSSST